MTYQPPAFESIDEGRTIRGIEGTLILVRNPGCYDEPDDLGGQHVLIDGKRYYCRGVESFRICRPYPKSLDFALMVVPA